MTVLPLTRRDALRLFAAQMTLSLMACSKPDEEIVPYVRMPEGLVPGDPLRFATTLPVSGFGQGVIAVSIDGRPIKIDGNPAHPSSLGATSAFLEASVLSLYDPDRSQAVTENGQIASWQAFRAALLRQLQPHADNRGRGLRLLTGRITSPTLQRQMSLLLQTYPDAAWHLHEPVDDDAEREGARLAFGRPLQAVVRLDEARAVLALDADPLGPGPDQIRNARDWARLRHADDAANFSRVYAAESAPTLTGIKADHRLAAHPDVIRSMAIAVANTLGAGLPQPDLPAPVMRFAMAAARDLAANPGHAVVLAGRTQAADVHALAHWINARLAAPQTLVEPAGAVAGTAAKTLDDLVRDLDAGAVDTLIILDTNPAYDAAPSLRVADALRKARFSVHAGQHADETAALCRWHVPLSHPLESWSDLRARDGTASIVQPLINPLYGTVTAHEVLAVAAGQDGKAYDLVRATWQPSGGADFESWWRAALHDGVIAGSGAKPVTPPPPPLPDVTPVAAAAASAALSLVPDASVWDGRFANNPWLQECPKPVGKEVWGNALAISPVDADRLKLATGDIVTLSSGDQSIETPVRVDRGVAPGVGALPLGYGRRAAGKIGNGVGANAYAMRRPGQSWLIRDVTMVRTGAQRAVLTTQRDVKLDGDTRDLYPMRVLADAGPAAAAEMAPDALPTLLPNYNYDTYAWGMVIDTSVCIGCNACIVACQSENNIPVVGPEEIARGRDMHWLRVDFYEQAGAHLAPAGFQPVPCMQCEQAPCEPVCPVAASVHDGEGLNAQVYNRCIGTRFCEANCPYKVRRFNFFGYADGQEYANLGSESIKAQHNPDVSVRQRGVMEKCTYCVQRISRARRDAEKDNRKIAPDGVVTACQSACPTRAISFGDIKNPAAEVSRQKTQPHHYALLGHLGTRPRTTYLADIRNVDADLDRGHE